MSEFAINLWEKIEFLEIPNVFQWDKKTKFVYNPITESIKFNRIDHWTIFAYRSRAKTAVERTKTKINNTL